MKHVIGIDFGTSTSMIKTAVRDGKTDTLETKPVTFTQSGNSSTPTLIRKKGDAVWYGRDAELNERLDAPLYRNFKILLRSENPQERQEAVELLEEFFRYLYQSYAEQKNFLPGGAEEIETIVSYPAQWSREQQELVINAAKKAGFPNVSGMDEPSAAVNCILKAKQKDIEKAGILYAGKPLNVLVVDMGAGTTDLAFVTVTVENGKLQTVIRGTWPEAGSHVIYGGSQMDLRLEEMMRTWLTDSGLPETMAQNLVKGQRSSIKSWKENTLSALLAKDMTADGFSNITSFLNTVGMTAKPFPAINRDSFADLFRAELENFVKVISSVPQNLRDEAELVILTGGNSEWFWIPDVMLGADTRFGDVGLKNIRSNPDRLIRMEQPAETVSRGLVYDQNMVIVSPPIKQQDAMKGEVKAPSTQAPQKPDEGSVEQPFEMLVEDRIWISGRGEVALGRIRSGEIREGDYVIWQRNSASKQVKVLGISAGKELSKSASAGTEVGLLLEGVSKNAIQKGDVLKKEKQPETRSYHNETNCTPEKDFSISVSVQNSSECVITKYKGMDKSVIIPERINGYRVCAIGENAFSPSSSMVVTTKHRLGIKKINTVSHVVIPKTVRKIEKRAFNRCLDLEEVILHEDIESIGREAFAECPNLKRLDFGCSNEEERTVCFPKTLKRIGFMAFSIDPHDGTETFKCEFNRVYLSKKTLVDEPTPLDKFNWSLIGCPKTFERCEVVFYEDT